MLFLRRVGVTLGYLKKMGKGYSNSLTPLRDAKLAAERNKKEVTFYFEM